MKIWDSVYISINFIKKAFSRLRNLNKLLLLLLLFATLDVRNLLTIHQGVHITYFNITLTFNVKNMLVNWAHLKVSNN